MSTEPHSDRTRPPAEQVLGSLERALCEPPSDLTARRHLAGMRRAAMESSSARRIGVKQRVWSDDSRYHVVPLAGFKGYAPLVAVAAVWALILGLAAVGELPDRAQNLVAETVSRLGISIPDPDDGDASHDPMPDGRHRDGASSERGVAPTATSTTLGPGGDGDPEGSGGGPGADPGDNTSDLESEAPGPSNQGQGNEGQGNEGQGNQGQGNEGQGNQGQGNEGQGNQGQGNQGQGNQGQGNQGQGNQGQGNQGQGNQGQGNQGQGNQGQGNQGQGNQGQGNQGQGQGNQGR